MLPDRQITAITDHISRHIGDPEDVLHELIPLDLHIDIHVVSPTPKRNFYTLVTSGMSERAMATPRKFREYQYAELMICLPSDWSFGEEVAGIEGGDWPASLLQMVARIPDQYGIWFASDHTIPNGDPPEPFSEEVDFCCVMFRQPKTAPAEFATLKVGRKTIHFYGVVPLYRDEMDFALSEGHETLAARLDAAGVTELLDARRPSVPRVRA